MKVRSQSEVAQSCPTLSDLMDCSLPGSSIYGIFQAKVLEWGAIAFSISTSNNYNNGENLVSTFHVLRAVLSILNELFGLLLRTV